VRTSALTLTGRRCPCGAAIERGREICRKCDARIRWQRRKSPHHVDEEL
jgi:hypothetical protein